VPRVIGSSDEEEEKRRNKKRLGDKESKINASASGSSPPVVAANFIATVAERIVTNCWRIVENVHGDIYL